MALQGKLVLIVSRSVHYHHQSTESPISRLDVSIYFREKMRPKYHLALAVLFILDTTSIESPGKASASEIPTWTSGHPKECNTRYMLLMKTFWGLKTTLR